MRIYGLTGGIASGKSEAARLFSQMAIPVIDADSVAHSLLEEGELVAAAVVDAFGEGILTDGTIDREKLGRVVFRDRVALERLNGIVHSAVRDALDARCRALAEEGHSATIIEAALHAEDGKLRPGIDGLIVVDCPREKRLARLMRDRGLSEEEATRRIDAQTPPENKFPLARWVIRNTGTLEDLAEQVSSVVEEI